MKKIGKRPITEADTDISKLQKKKYQKHSDKFFGFFFSFISLQFRKIGICFGNRPIADFFHDQTIFLKDYELYIIGHSLRLEPTHLPF